MKIQEYIEKIVADGDKKEMEELNKEFVILYNKRKQMKEQGLL